jgi:hypothetical protein
MEPEPGWRVKRELKIDQEITPWAPPAASHCASNRRFRSAM